MSLLGRIRTNTLVLALALAPGYAFGQNPGFTEVYGFTDNIIHFHIGANSQTWWPGVEVSGTLTAFHSNGSTTQTIQGHFGGSTWDADWTFPVTEQNGCVHGSITNVTLTFSGPEGGQTIFNLNDSENTVCPFSGGSGDGGTDFGGGMGGGGGGGVGGCGSPGIFATSAPPDYVVIYGDFANVTFSYARIDGQAVTIAYAGSTQINLYRPGLSYGWHNFDLSGGNCGMGGSVNFQPLPPPPVILGINPRPPDYIEIYGENLGPVTAVLLDGVQLYIAYVSENQLNAEYALGPISSGSHTVQVGSQGGWSDPFTVNYP